MKPSIGVGDNVRLNNNALFWKVIGLDAEGNARLESPNSGRTRIEPLSNLIKWPEQRFEG